ncbi:hypothetical protein [Actinomadura rupiterrae]|uniref:hypothetical protein n=1 Tax=Actinomadura rupiterrae TaxID=559627 RepID=UPI0020A35700|nr:hypothetical protein [Actinomadura rupiterrae]MCP2338892.1 hypothetical protein [Actinomadura rupiterrae]
MIALIIGVFAYFAFVLPHQLDQGREEAVKDNLNHAEQTRRQLADAAADGGLSEQEADYAVRAGRGMLLNYRPLPTGITIEAEYISKNAKAGVGGGAISCFRFVGHEPFGADVKFELRQLPECPLPSRTPAAGPKTPTRS